MAAGQDSQQLAGLKITHAHHTPTTQQTSARKVQHFSNNPVGVEADLGIDYRVRLQNLDI